MRIANLHTHSEFTFLGSLLKVEDIVGLCAFYGYNTVCIADLFSTFGFFALQKASEKEGLKPIYGIQIFVKDVEGKKSFPILLFALDSYGLKNIFMLNTLANLKFAKTSKYTLEFEDLKSHKDGLSVLVEEEILNYIDKIDLLEKTLERYKEVFKENFYIEFNYTGQKKIPLMKELLSISQLYNIKGIPACETRYRKEGKDAFDFLSLLREKSYKKNEKGRKIDLTYDYSFKTKDEFLHIFKNHPELLENLSNLVDSINVSIDLKTPKLYSFSDEKNFKNLCEERLEKFLAKKSDEEKSKYKERFEKEFNLIVEKKLENFFLLAYEIVSFLKKNKIPYGPGRGSSASSFILYLLGVTKVDPVRFNILFERFLNPARVQLPDIDIDICWKKRKILFSYLLQRFEGNIAHIATINRLFPHTLVNEISKVYRLKKEKVRLIKKFFPPASRFSIIDVLKGEKDFLEIYTSDNEIKDFIDIVMKLEGLAYHSSVHAGGIIITPERLENYASIEVSRSGDIVAQLTKDDIEDTGFVKLDLLGLRFTTIIDETRRKVKLKKIPLNDRETFEMISSGDTIGIFQLESSGMRELLKEIRPDSIEVLANTIALYRPGPIKSKMTEEYVKRRQNPSYEKEKTFGIFKDTSGILIYQEQILLLAIKFARFSWEKAEVFRKAISDKDVSAILQMKEEFISGCISNGLTEQQASRLFSIVVDFGSYAFNKAHSISYAYNAYIGAYLKKHYTLDFFVSLLNNYIGFLSKMDRYLFEIRYRGIGILPFDINSSDILFKKENNSIRPGLILIKYVGKKLAKEIVKEREENGNFKDLIDFCVRMKKKGLNIRALEYLIMAGCFDFTSAGRKNLLAIVPEVLRIISSKQSEEEKGVTELFPLDEEISMEAILKKYKIEEESEKEKLEMEFKSTDFFVTFHPLESVKEKIIDWEIDKIEKMEFLKYAVIVAFLQGIRIYKTLTDEKMAILTIFDETAGCSAVVFPKVFRKYENIIKTGEVYLFKGRCKGKKIFVEEMFELNN